MSNQYGLSRTRENPSMLEQISNIPESKLPEILSVRVQKLEDTNRAYKVAQQKEANAQRKVEAAIRNADRLLEHAQSAGGHTAKVRKRFFGLMQYTTTEDRLDAAERNLRELIDSGIESAEAQKQLTQVLGAFHESQTALLHVQKAQMEYQTQVADATKFLYGLSAYNMAASQSVLVKLQAVLSGASKDELGELAQQQLMLALDQLKNQENIMLRMRETKSSLGKLEETMRANNIKLIDISVETTEHARQLATHAQLLEEAAEADEEQDKLIAENRRLIEEFGEADEEQDKLIAENRQLIEEYGEADEEQDKLIAEHSQLIEDLGEADDAQDKLIAENRQLIEEYGEADEEQDKLIAEHSQLIEDLGEADNAQDKLIAENRQMIEEYGEADEEQDARIDSHEQAINEFLEADEAQDKLIAEHSRLLEAAAKNDEEHNAQIEAINSAILKTAETDDQQDKLIKQLMVVYKKQQAVLKNQAADIQALAEKNAKLEQELLYKCNKKQFSVTSALAAIALILSIIQFFI